LRRGEVLGLRWDDVGFELGKLWVTRQLRADHAALLQDLPIPVEDQANHKPDDLTGRKVLSGVLVGLLVELPEKLLEDGSHLVIRDDVGMEVYLAELLDGLVEEAFLLKLIYRVAQLEPL
jgi:integrase